MNGFVRYYCRKMNKACTRFVGTRAKLERQAQWLKPEGYETNILIYNPITRCKVPLILKNRNLLTWYVCGPTVYDSAHIGHAMTYVNSDIIRRILSDHFGINIVKVMCITDIDDKIIQRSKISKQSHKDLAKHYENEFIADMKRLNVIQPQLYCRVSDYIPQIIEFVRVMLEKRNAYIANDGSVYFDTGKHTTYGKFSAPLENIDHPDDKKSSADFCVWKAAKEGEPFWESPWGPGRPGWHVECSAIASTVFGNSVDIHSGGIDLAFPHHENEEAQSCCYHQVEQWVNYWLHCGHLFLEDTKMSKSLKNTISIAEFLDKYTANHFRLLCLLTNYKAGLKFSHALMANAVEIVNKLEHFINDCENYIAGRWIIGSVDEAALLRCLEETRNSVDAALADDFDTPRATKTLLNLIGVTNKMLYDKVTKASLLEGNSRTLAAPTSNPLYLPNSLSGLSSTGSCIYPALNISYSESDESDESDESEQSELVTEIANCSLVELIFRTRGARMCMLPYRTQDAKMTHGSCIPAVAAVANYLSTMFSKFGISSSTSTDDHATNNIVECFLTFRRTVRNRALRENSEDLFTACDQARADLLACGITVKDCKNETIWSMKKY